VEGSIVNLSSIGALRGRTYSAPYAASNAGVTQLTQSAAVQYGPLGIRANCIVPGQVDTPMPRGTTGSAPEFAQRAAEIRLGRAGNPENHLARAPPCIARSDVRQRCGVRDRRRLDCALDYFFRPEQGGYCDEHQA
jgi:NAD(P)-dependent dehydrogenase (short-subunit alcohol dehydrogenase family)